MPAIRPEPQDTSFETPAAPQVGALEYYGNLAYDALYHSPVSAAYRWSDLTQEENDDRTDLLSAKDANQQFGMDGEINFDEPIRAGAAQIIQSRKLVEDRRNYLLQSGGTDHWGRRVTGFGVSMAAQLVDPVNLASMFVPVVGEEAEAANIGRSLGLLRAGLISPETVQKMVGSSVLRQRLAKGAIEGLVGQSAVRPMDILATLQEHGDYSVTDEFKNLGVGAVLGATVHAGLGLLFDKLNKLKTGLDEIKPETHEANTLSAAADLVKDEPVTSPAKLTSVDHEVVKNDLQTVNNDDVFEIAHEMVDRLSQMKKAGVQMTPIQESKLNGLTSLLHEPRYKDYQTARELASFLGMTLDPGETKMPEQFRSLLRPDEVPEKAIQSETQSRVEQIAQNEKQPTPEKELDTTSPSDKITGTEPIPEKPEPLVQMTDKKMGEAQAQLEEESKNWEKQMGELTPEEQEYVNKSLNEDLKPVTKGIDAGVGCILGKAL
jgi:hypothetical protein